MREDEILEPLDFGMKILQKKEGFRFGEDAILVSEFFSPTKSGKVLEIGTGKGIISLIISRNPKVTQITSVEIQEEMANMSKRTVELNNLTDKIEILHLDIKNLKRGNTYEYIISNPPYMRVNSGKVNSSSNKAISRHEVALNIKDFVKESKRLLKPGGSLTLVYRTDRLIELINILSENNFYIKRVQNIFSKSTKESKLVLLEAIKGKNNGFKVLEPLYI
jgi:16S rRNA (guanine1207-N2)-methyltransferase